MFYLYQFLIYYVWFWFSYLAVAWMLGLVRPAIASLQHDAASFFFFAASFILVLCRWLS